jgi:hypothetical protein
LPGIILQVHYNRRMRLRSTSPRIQTGLGGRTRRMVIPLVLSHCLERDGFFRAEHDSPLCWTDFPCERIKLLGERHGSGAIDSELALANHVHELDAGKHIAGRSE